MNLTYTRPGELRKPDVEVLPDSRIRITRYIAAGHGDRDYSEVTEAVGTADGGLATALLVRKGMARIEGKDAIVKTYEVRNASSETLVGLPDIQYTESGQKTMIYDYVQMSSGTYTPGTIGSTSAPGDATCILRTEQVEDDGTTRQIRRVFINKGLLQQSDETKNNGALLLKTFVYLNDAPDPNPPTGYTLVSQRTENPNGLETTTYTYAKGSGQISQDDENRFGGALLVRVIRWITTPGGANPIPTPSGYSTVSTEYVDQDGYRVWTARYTKGLQTQYAFEQETRNNGALTIRTKRAVSTNAISTNPCTPDAGFVTISDSYVTEDIYRLWTLVQAQGSGDVSSSTDVRNNNKLKVYKKTALGSSPSAPNADPAIGGSVVTISTSTRQESGYTVYDVVWAQGNGEISRETRYNQSSNQGTTGSTVITIRYLSDVSVSSNPITTPTGTVLISFENQVNDGYIVWSAVYAKGTGTVVNDIETKNGGKLIIYHKVALGAAPSTPVGASVVLISQNVRNESGFDVYDYTWASGNGIVGEKIQYKEGGLRLLNRDIILPTGTTSYATYTPLYGIEVDSSYVEGDGIRRYSVTWIQSNSGGDPLAIPAVQFDSKVPFTYPGRAKAYYTSFTTGGYTSHKAYDVFLSPPVQCLVDSTTYIYYVSSNAVPSPSYPLWNPTEWATMRAKWIGWSDSPRSKVEGLRGYIKVNTGINGTSTTATDVSMFGDRVFAATDFKIELSGGPSDPGGSVLTLSIEKVPAFVKTDGTQYYRVTEVIGNILAQSNLPV